MVESWRVGCRGQKEELWLPSSPFLVIFAVVNQSIDVCHRSIEELVDWKLRVGSSIASVILFAPNKVQYVSDDDQRNRAMSSSHDSRINNTLERASTKNRCKRGSSKKNFNRSPSPPKILTLVEKVIDRFLVRLVETQILVLTPQIIALWWWKNPWLKTCQMVILS